MLFLQGDLTYQGPEDARSGGAIVYLEFPQYEGVDDTASNSVVLMATGKDHITFEKKLSDQRYAQHIPTAQLFGENYARLLVKYMTSLTKDGASVRLRDLTIPFKATFGTNEENVPQPLDAIYFMSTARVATEKTPRGETPAEDSRPPDFHPLFGSSSGIANEILGPDPIDASKANKLIESGIFCVNKAVYVDFMNHHPQELPAENESMLMYLIAANVDLSGSAPALYVAPDSERQKICKEIFQYFGYPEMGAPAINTALINAFPTFFDFSLQIPTVQPLSIAGTLTLHMDNESPKPEDFKLQHISARFSYLDAGVDTQAVQRISRHDWPLTVEVTENQAKFAWTDKVCNIANIHGPVTISVMSYDNLELYSAQFSPTDAAMQRLDIELHARSPVRIPGDSLVPGKPSSKALRGKIVCLAKSCTLKGTVVVQAKTKDEDDWIAVATGQSDKMGNFTTNYPFGTYKYAQILTSLDTKSQTKLGVKEPPAAATRETISDDFIFIVLPIPPDGATDKDDCGCHANVAAGRLPSQDDIMQSDQYTQDVGGTCTSLTVPNRTLREYRYTAVVRNSDPDVACYILSNEESDDAVSDVSTITYTLDQYGKDKVTRHMVDLDYPVHWEDAPAAGNHQVIYEAVTVATGHVLHYKSEMRADGYSLGDLLYSLPLAPGQKKYVAIVDATTSLKGGQSQSVAQSERLAADLTAERDIMDEIGGDVGEQIAASSQSTSKTSGRSAKIGGTYNGVVSGNLGISGGSAKTSSSAQQSSARSLGGFFNEMLRQGINQNAQSYRQRNSSIVTTVSQGQRNEVETTVVSNHNHCHSLTIMHYEVLRHFAIFQELVDVEECVFIPFPLTKFSPENISRWSDVLSTRLLPLHSNTYLRSDQVASTEPQHPLVYAFDAVERVRTNWSNVDWPEGQYCDEVIDWIQGEFTATVNISRPGSRYDMIKSFPGVQKQMKNFLGMILRLPPEKLDISDSFIRVDPDFQTRSPADCIRISNVDKSDTVDFMSYFYASEIDKLAWRAYARALRWTGDDEGVRLLVKKYFLGATVSEWDIIWTTRVAPEVYSNITNTLTIDGVIIGDFTALTPYRGYRQQTRVSFSGSSQRTRKDVQFLTLGCTIKGVSELLNAGVEYTVQGLHISYSAKHFNGVLCDQTINNDLFDGVRVFCPLSEAEMRYPRREDRWLARRLINHLNQNLEYYNRVLLYSLDPERRFMVLDGFHIEVFNAKGQTQGYRSLSSVLKNVPVTVAGNAIVFPVSSGYKVDRSMIIDQYQSSDPDTALLNVYRPEMPPAPYRISVPCRGVYSESLVGQCDSCERLKPNSSQDWSKFSTDEAPLISGAQVPSSVSFQPYQPTLDGLDTAVVKMQDAPTLPPSSIGLGDVVKFLEKSDLFKDLTGLQVTQNEASKILQAAVTEAAAAQVAANKTSAKDVPPRPAPPDTASKQIDQSHNTKNSTQIMDNIKEAYAGGFITKEDADKYVKQHVQSQIDGGQAQKAAMEAQKAVSKPSIADAAVKAVNGNKNVKATTVDGDGNMSTVDISSGHLSTSVLAKVSPAVPIIKQGDVVTSWATVITMLVSWKERKPQTFEEVLKVAGDEFVDLWKTNRPLPSDLQATFLTAMGLVSEPPGSYSPSQLVNWVKMYGPLWVTTRSDPDTTDFSPYAKILVQIDGQADGTGNQVRLTWIHPGAGKLVTQSLRDFLVGYELTGTQGGAPDLRLFTQVIHFGAKIKELDLSDQGSSTGTSDDFHVL